MTTEGERGARWSRRALVAMAVAALLVVAGLLALRAVVRAIDPLAPLEKARAGETTVTQAVVVERMRTVAQLVTSETTVRDVVVYENRRLGFTKRALVVVTGRVLAGIDLDRGTEVQVDHERRRVRVVLPRASVISVEVTGMRTYDERSGLLNPFRPADRDTIFRLAREQLVRSAGETGVLAHADSSAVRLLEALVSVEGYETEVVLRGAERRPPATSEGAAAPLR